jgi:hypothetical protein
MDKVYTDFIDPNGEKIYVGDKMKELYSDGQQYIKIGTVIIKNGRFYIQDDKDIYKNSILNNHCNSECHQYKLLKRKNYYSTQQPL